MDNRKLKQKKEDKEETTKIKKDGQQDKVNCREGFK